MSGFYTSFGYVGFVGKTRILFATEQDYREFMEEIDSEE